MSSLIAVLALLLAFLSGCTKTPEATSPPPVQTPEATAPASSEVPSLAALTKEGCNKNLESYIQVVSKIPEGHEQEAATNPQIMAQSKILGECQKSGFLTAQQIQQVSMQTFEKMDAQSETAEPASEGDSTN